MKNGGVGITRRLPAQHPNGDGKEAAGAQDSEVSAEDSDVATIAQRGSEA